MIIKKEEVMELGSSLLLLPIRMSIFGHTSIRGHMRYTTTDSHLTAYLHWLSNQNEYNLNELIKVCWGEETFNKLKLNLLETTTKKIFKDMKGIVENEVGEPAEPKVKGLESIKLPEDKQYLHDVLFGKPIEFNVQFPSGEEADISLTWDELLNNLSTEGLLKLKEEIHRRLSE